MKASIDIGSNSILLLAGKFEDGKFIESLNMAGVTGLGRDVDQTGQLSAEAMDLAFDFLKRFKEKLDEIEIKASETLVTATEASRNAKNFTKFSARIRSELGFEIKLLNAEGEAYFCARGVNQGSSQAQLIIDLGGASTELIKFNSKPFLFENYLSLPMGSVRGTEWVKEGVFDQKFQAAFKNIDLIEYKSDQAICVAGTITTYAAMILGLESYSDSEVLGKIIEFEFLQDFVRKLEKMTTKEILKNYPLAGKRVSTIVGGGKVIVEICKLLGIKKIIVSTFGLRYGLILVDRIEDKYLIKEN